MEVALQEQTEQVVTKRETIEEIYKNSQAEYVNVCRPGDKECHQKWVDAFSDCV